MIQKSSVTVVYPTYNEKDNIGPMIDATLASCRDRKIEILVVDDDSPDLTWKNAKEIEKMHQEVRVIRRVGERGLTSALNRGIQEAKNDVVVWLDCDFQHPPEKIETLLNQIDQGFDVAVGSRFLAKVSADDRLTLSTSKNFTTYLHGHLSKTLCRMLSRTFGSDFTDWTSGLIAVKREILVSHPLNGSHGDYFIELLVWLRHSKYRCTEIPYQLSIRKSGESKTAPNIFHLIGNGFVYLKTILKLKAEYSLLGQKTIRRTL